MLLLSLAACGPLPKDVPVTALGTTYGDDPYPSAEFTPAMAVAHPPAMREATLTPARPALTPAMLKGMAAADLQRLLGAPSFQRREATAEIWQYFGPGCVLDLFLYDDGGNRRVVYHQLRSQVPGRAPDTACLNDLLAGRRGQRLG